MLNNFESVAKIIYPKHYLCQKPLLYMHLYHSRSSSQFLNAFAHSLSLFANSTLFMKAQQPSQIKLLKRSFLQYDV